MKLLFYPECHDVFKLGYKHRQCECGHCSGRYVNNSEAVVNGNGYSLAIGNGSLANAIHKLHTKGKDGARGEYYKECPVDYCWVRPHEGAGSPHTTIEKGDDNEQA